MDPKIIQLIVSFLARVDLKGAEVPAFNSCIAELRKFSEVEDGVEDRPSSD